MNPEWIGWLSTGVLIATVGRQAWTQWRSRSTAGVSHWLYVGQFATSAGFVVYSAMLGNRVFLVSNVFLVVIAAIGQVLLLRNRAIERATAGVAGGASSRTVRPGSP